MYYLEKIRAKALLAVVPAVLFGAFALMPSAASAFPPCETTILCAEGEPGGGVETPLRDDATAPPEGGGYGADMMATNSQGVLALTATTFGVTNSNPKNYAYFGLELESNPETSCQAGKEEAKGSVTFADIQNASPSPVFAGISPGGFGAWPISVRSDHCETNPGKVTVSNVHLFFPELLGAVASGTFTGTYVQPNAVTCEGGGVELDKAQPGVTVETPLGPSAAEISNGAGGAAFLCLVDANNYVFPAVAPEWEPLEGAIWKD